MLRRGTPHFAGQSCALSLTEDYVSYVATAVARDGAGSAALWSAHDLDLDGVEDIDGIAEEIRSAAPDAEVRILFLEEEDEYLGIIRVDGEDDGDPVVFLSDASAADTYSYAAMLIDAIDVSEAVENSDGDTADGDTADDDAEEVLAEAIDDEDEELVATPGRDADPAGALAVVDDLGTSSRELVDLCEQEGSLPSDVVDAVCEAAGALEALEELRAG